MEKKGSIQDLGLILTIMIGLGVIVLIGFKITSEFNDYVQDSDDVPAQGKLVSAAVTNHYPGIVDNTFLYLLIGMGLVAVALAAMIRVHPVFIIFYLLALIVLIVVAAALSNVYEEMSQNAVLADVAGQLVIANAIIGWLPIVVGVFGSLLAFIMYKTWREALI